MNVAVRRTEGDVQLWIGRPVTDAVLFCFRQYQKVQLEETMVETVFKFGWGLLSGYKMKADQLDWLHLVYELCSKTRC
jgi:hypothetical protein